LELVRLFFLFLCLIIELMFVLRFFFTLFDYDFFLDAFFLNYLFWLLNFSVKFILYLRINLLAVLNPPVHFILLQFKHLYVLKHKYLIQIVKTL